MFAITAIMMILGSQLSAAEHGTDDDVGWDRPQRNFSVAVFDLGEEFTRMGNKGLLSQKVAWLNVRGLEGTWDRSLTDRKIFTTSITINMIAGNLFRQDYDCF